jgi:hypothetical protein
MNKVKGYKEHRKKKIVLLLLIEKDREVIRPDIDQLNAKEREGCTAIKSNITSSSRTGAEGKGWA